MSNNFDNIKKEIQEKNRLIDKLSHCNNKDGSKIQQLKLELDKLLYIYYKSITRGGSAKALL